MIQAQLARSVLAERRSWITWGGILTLALTLRLALLDLAPLDSIEAGLVLPAWQAAQALPVDLSVGPQSPLFTSLTTLVFWLFGASDVTARLIPALAGAALAVTPALLPPFCGPWARVAAGALLATSPLALELSRRADPASLTILCVALVFGAVLRFGWDRPRWAPWLFAGALGAGLASQGGTVIALILAAVAGFIAGALWSDQEPWQLPMIDYGRARGPALFGVAAAVVAATCGLFDLRGLGFLAGDVWGQAATLLLRPALSGWQLFSLLAYAAPLLALAVLEIVWGIRAKDRFAAWLAIWLGLAVAVAIIAGSEQTTALLLPVWPAAVLAGRAAATWRERIPEWRLGEPGITAWSITLAFGGVLILGIADSFGAGRPFTRLAIILAGLVLALGWAWPRAWRSMEGGLALGILAAGVYAIVAVSTIGRVSFGGSPFGSEPLRLEATQPALRDFFAELTLAASLDPTVRLAIQSGPADLARWYGRALPTAAPGTSGAFVVSAADQASGQLPRSGGRRVPATVHSMANPSELNLLGIGRWLISRNGLFQPQSADVIVTRGS